MEDKKTTVTVKDLKEILDEYNDDLVIVTSSGRREMFIRYEKTYTEEGIKEYLIIG